MQEFLEIGQIMKLKGIDKVEEAELLKNFYLEVKREDEPELEDDTYYIVDLLRTRSLF